ncbi:hypothetical protein DFH27DRAFT_581994 [Peziza echinospora]|nr:hypothetical protein DFH27DRAFT_581994 [Peziza echinospora]
MLSLLIHVILIILPISNISVLHTFYGIHILILLANSPRHPSSRGQFPRLPPRPPSAPRWQHHQATAPIRSYTCHPCEAMRCRAALLSPRGGP